MAKLVVRKGRNVGAEHRLNGERMSVGRRSSAPVPVLDAKASREHALILRDGAHFYVVDLSRNGTFVNDAPISQREEDPTPLEFGDRIRIGDTVFEMVDETKEAIPLEVPGYSILEKVGAGGMGTVYKARQLSMDRVVALKVLNDKYSNNKEFVDRFIREARAAGKLNHPNVIHVHDVSKAHGRHYFSMEFVDGQSVKDCLRLQARMPVTQVLDLVLQAAKALEFAHEHGIVHRDIKPDNIMFTKEGVVKIADLGIAKSFDDEIVPGSGAARVMGTPHYIAPEQALGHTIDHRVDIYSLGATCYHMLTGTTPFTGRTAHEVVKAHLQDAPQPIRIFAPETPEELCFIVERMMAKAPEKRYPNMTALIEDLEKVHQAVGAAGSAALPPPPGVAALRRMGTQEASTGVQSPVRTLAFIALLAVLFLAALAGAIFGLKWYRERSQHAGPPPPPPVPVTPPDVRTPVPAGNAQERLARARELLASDPLSTEAVEILQKLRITNPTLDEARQMLSGVEARRVAAERQAAERKARTAFEEAQQFENEHPKEAERFPEIAAKYQAAAAAAKDFPDLAAQAQVKAADWEKRGQAAREAQAKAELGKTVSAVTAAAAQNDFDAARAACQDFLTRFAAHPLKADAEARLKGIDESADKAFQTAQLAAQQYEQDPAHLFGAAWAVWEQYLQKTKDAAHKEAADKARQDLATRCEKARDTELAKTVEAAKRLAYGEGLTTVDTLAKQLAGAETLLPALQQRRAALVLERDLHLKVVKIIQERVREKPVSLPFNIAVPGMGSLKGGSILGIRPPDMLLLSPKDSGASIGREFAKLSPQELYQVYRLFLPEPTAQEYKALVAFCEDRGLADEAAVIKDKAAP